MTRSIRTTIDISTSGRITISATTLLWGENGPKHADAWATFEDTDGATKVTLAMAFSSACGISGLQRVLARSNSACKRLEN
jgi:hypothetical protein